MSIKDKFKKFRDDYVINQVKNAKIPDFKATDIRRCRITFSGRVQNVGFRLEVFELAKRLNLTGFCKNLDNGAVLAELQGSAEKIDYLVSYMENLKRIKIKEKVVEELEVDVEEKDFLKL